MTLEAGRRNLAGFFQSFCMFQLHWDIMLTMLQLLRIM